MLDLEIFITKVLSKSEFNEFEPHLEFFKFGLGYYFKTTRSKSFFVVYILRKVLFVRKVSSETSISELVNHGREVNQILRETVIQVS